MVMANEATQMSNVGSWFFWQNLLPTTGYTYVTHIIYNASDQFQGSKCISGSHSPSPCYIHPPPSLFLFFCPYPSLPPFYINCFSLAVNYVRLFVLNISLCSSIEEQGFVLGMVENKASHSSTFYVCWFALV